jgi:hypothetical protein
MVAQSTGSSVVASPRPATNRVRPVVASVVASRVKPQNATTDNATTNQNATTGATTLAWRIEINRRPKAGGGYSYHWLYRFGSGADRRAVYGGTIDRLMATNPLRWATYLVNAEDK